MGWHALRHSFASNCAAAGLDQRVINEWMGHQTEEMVRRYRHLFPDQARKAIDVVFGQINWAFWMTADEAQTQVSRLRKTLEIQ